MNCINDVDKIKNFVCIKDYESYVTKARLLLSIKFTTRSYRNKPVLQKRSLLHAMRHRVHKV